MKKYQVEFEQYWGFMKDPVGKLSSGYDSFKVIIAGIIVTIAGFTGYEYAKGGTYLATNLSLSAVDGIGKILKFGFNSFLTKIKGKVDFLFNSQKVKVLSKFLSKWTPSLKKHIFEGDLKEELIQIGNSKSYNFQLSGVHYKTAIKKQRSGLNTAGDIRIKNKVDKGNGFYEANVEGYSSIKYETGDKNNKGMAEDDKGWIKKKDKSTFFPDSWSEEKIKEEIAEAWGKKEYKGPTKDGGKKYWGSSLSGQKYEIIEGIDGSVTTVYGIF